MPETENPAKTCGEESCGLRSAAPEPGHCTAWNRLDFDLARIVRQGDELPTTCPFIAELVLPTLRQLVMRTRRASDEMLSLTMAAALDPNSKRELPKNTAEFVRFARRIGLDELRKEKGRYRCSQCLSYRYADHTCRRAFDSAHEPHEFFGTKLETNTSPKEIGCREFSDRKNKQEFDPERHAAGRHTEGAITTRLDLTIAMKKLLAESPLQYLVVTAREIEKESWEVIAKRRGKTVDQVTYAHRLAIEKLRRWMGGWGAGSP